MKKLAKLTALTMTAGMLLAACGDANDVDDDLPGTEEPADDDLDGGLEDDGMDDGLEDDGMEDDGLEDDMDDDE
ncbi:hypothetical protein [Alkalibacterium pelagium]|uniref:DNA primase n=1 Tax=Alkalibacterium pelagium TaxID=426702 RepID=A0A1H7F0A9_9LACT|nr:hypothetical protein [Alkalibacterium pelagium]GEN49626.1 hypothetical protein APE02nite_02910 [Alkalibacterium pelagium]SEK17742.1 hypothetical protein SAMN04488099_10144 [Alkalibacterium pelagium]